MQKNKNKKNFFFLKELDHKDITKTYVQWMNNYEIVKYTDHSLKKHTTKNWKTNKNTTKKNYVTEGFQKKGEKILPFAEVIA